MGRIVLKNLKRKSKLLVKRKRKTFVNQYEQFGFRGTEFSHPNRQNLFMLKCLKKLYEDDVIQNKKDVKKIFNFWNGLDGSFSRIKKLNSITGNKVAAIVTYHLNYSCSGVESLKKTISNFGKMVEFDSRLKSRKRNSIFDLMLDEDIFEKCNNVVFVGGKPKVTKYGNTMSILRNLYCQYFCQGDFEFCDLIIEANFNYFHTFVKELVAAFKYRKMLEYSPEYCGSIGKALTRILNDYFLYVNNKVIHTDRFEGNLVPFVLSRKTFLGFIQFLKNEYGSESLFKLKNSTAEKSS